jgi:hypothetical protein
LFNSRNFQKVDEERKQRQALHSRSRFAGVARWAISHGEKLLARHPRYSLMRSLTNGSALLEIREFLRRIRIIQRNLHNVQHKLPSPLPDLGTLGRPQSLDDLIVAIRQHTTKLLVKLSQRRILRTAIIYLLLSTKDMPAHSFTTGLRAKKEVDLTIVARIWKNSGGSVASINPSRENTECLGSMIFHARTARRVQRVRCSSIRGLGPSRSL